jgi:hypothetical protein
MNKFLVSEKILETDILKITVWTDIKKSMAVSLAFSLF